MYANGNTDPAPPSRRMTAGVLVCECLCKVSVEQLTALSDVQAKQPGSVAWFVAVGQIVVVCSISAVGCTQQHSIMHQVCLLSLSSLCFCSCSCTPPPLSPSRPAQQHQQHHVWPRV